ncbi:hypothetical protein N0V88_007381 [Collariella sp. IMI 366227]|nr:hypothetical protein N0V88_007381 [Collariella sp. IMI 366227]
MTARSVAATHLRGILNRWPKDVLRPDCQLQNVLAKRLQSGVLAPKTAGVSQELADLRQVNALYSLLEDRYKNKHRAGDSIFEPKSNPTYYKDLIKELEEVPNRTWLQRLKKRLGGIIRFSE